MENGSKFLQFLNGGIKSSSLPITRPASPPFPLCLFIHAWNVNSYWAVKSLSLCPAISPVTLFSNLKPPPLPPLYFPCLLLGFGWGGRSSILKLWMDIWAVGFSGSCCPVLSPVIGSAWLINGGHCRWTPFSTDRHYVSQNFLSPFSPEWIISAYV